MNSPQPESLTCEAALERLDAAWLDPLPEELVDADLLAAREHLQECSTCWAKFEERRTADRRIQTVMQSVPIPTGLREQLLAQTVADASRVRTTDARRVGHNLHRRAWWISVAAMLLVSLAGGSWLWQLTHPQRVSMQTLCDQTPLTPEGLIAVDDPTKLPPLPATWRRVKGLLISLKTAHWFAPPKAREPVGWVAFEFQTGRSSSIRGVLLMTSQTNVSDPPAPLLVRPSWSSYTQRDGKPISVAGWSEHGVVYLCFVPGEPASLEKVLRATAPTSA